jgi:hypothetical protein
MTTWEEAGAWHAALAFQFPNPPVRSGVPKEAKGTESTCDSAGHDKTTGDDVSSDPWAPMGRGVVHVKDTASRFIVPTHGSGPNGLPTLVRSMVHRDFPAHSAVTLYNELDAWQRVLPQHCAVTCSKVEDAWHVGSTAQSPHPPLVVSGVPKEANWKEKKEKYWDGSGHSMTSSLSV